MTHHFTHTTLYRSLSVGLFGMLSLPMAFVTAHAEEVASTQSLQSLTDSQTSSSTNQQVAEQNITDVKHSDVLDDLDKSISHSNHGISKSQQKLNEFYQIDASSTHRCIGHWVSPSTVFTLNKTDLPKATEAKDGQTVLNALSSQTAMPYSKNTLYAQADYGYYDNDEYAELAGNVKILQNNQLIEAKTVKLNLQNGLATADGDIVFSTVEQNSPSKSNEAMADGQIAKIDTDGLVAYSGHIKNGEIPNTATGAAFSQGGMIGVANNMTYDIHTGETTAKDVAFASIGMQAHGYTSELSSIGDLSYRLKGVTFTTCPPIHQNNKSLSWQLQAQTIDLNQESGRGEAKNATLKVGNVPIFYLPYFNFPIDDQRRSGFLIPQGGWDSKNGVEVNIPYYLNLAPNYDATITTRLYSERNPMINGEFRYLTRHLGSGEIDASYLAKDRKYHDKNRHSIFLNHDWQSDKVDNLSAAIMYNQVSDSDYLNDFESSNQAGNQINLPRYIQANYYNDYLNGQLKFETFQTLPANNEDGQSLQDKDKPYARLPQFSLSYHLPKVSSWKAIDINQPFHWLDNINITGIHNSAYFKKSIKDNSEAEKSGLRIYDKLNMSYPIEKTWGYVLPQVALQHLSTSYDKDSRHDNQLSKEEGHQSIFIPQVSVDMGLNFYRQGSPFASTYQEQGGYQILTPRLKYVYTPYVNQDDIPNFNTRVASLNYQQLFSDSWFLGYDRLQDLHAITPAINYRYIDGMGMTRFDGSLAQQFYLDDAKVALTPNEPLFTQSSSGLVWETSTHPHQNFWLNVNGAMTPSYELNYLTTQLRYQPSKNSLYSIGFIERKNNPNTNQYPLSAYTASMAIPINEKWRVLASGQYDERTNTMREALMGIDYQDCCLGFAVYGRRYYNDLKPTDKPNQAIMAELRLNGLGGKEGRLSKLFTEKVFGFEPVDRAWKEERSSH